MIARALPKNPSESIPLPNFQSPKSYAAFLKTEIRIIKIEDENNSIIQDFSFYPLHGDKNHLEVHV